MSTPLEIGRPKGTTVLTEINTWIIQGIPVKIFCLLINQIFLTGSIQFLEFLLDLV